MPGADTVKLYCPNCGDIFIPPSSKYQTVDGDSSSLHHIAKGLTIGAYFGSTFAALFFQTYPELLAQPFAPSPSSLPQSTTTSTAPSPSPSPYAPVGGETITNPNPHGGQRPALGRVYTPKIYGFKVSERARSGPRMRWLRDRPSRAEELDTVDNKGRFLEGREGKGDEVEVKEEKKGRLFDEEEDENEDDEEEEEEEEGAPQAVQTERRR